MYNLIDLIRMLQSIKIAFRTWVLSIPQIIGKSKNILASKNMNSLIDFTTRGRQQKNISENNCIPSPLCINIIQKFTNDFSHNYLSPTHSIKVVKKIKIPNSVTTENSIAISVTG